MGLLLSLFPVDDTVSNLDLSQPRNGATAVSLGCDRAGCPSRAERGRTAGPNPRAWTDIREPRRDDRSEPEKDCPRRESYKHVPAGDGLDPMRRNIRLQRI